ncbi:unnamed protein product, partial [Heterosigma akashiwo]
KARAVEWFREALEHNVKAEKQQLDPRECASQSFLLNVGATLLRLCRPVLDDFEVKGAKIDPAFLLSAPATQGIYPADTTRLLALPEGAESAGALLDPRGPGLQAFGFVTQCFFLAYRALHLGLVQGLNRHVALHRHLGHAQRRAQAAAGDQMAQGQFHALLRQKFSAEVGLLQPELLADAALFYRRAAEWLLGAPAWP